MAWSNITVLDTAPGARILKSLMFRIRDNPIACADQVSVGVPASERPRLPECLTTTTSSVGVALASGGPGNQCQFVAAPKWHLAVFQTPGAWNISGAAAREYYVEMWGAGASSDASGGVNSKRGGGSGAYTSLLVSAGAGVAIGGVVALGPLGSSGAASVAGPATTLATGPGTGTAPGAPAGGAGAVAGTVGGTSTLVAALAGFASFPVDALGDGSPGAPAPMLGGSPRMAAGSTLFGKGSPGAGGSYGGSTVGAVTSQSGGDGMVCVWYLE